MSWKISRFLKEKRELKLYVSTTERAAALELLLNDNKTYSIAFIVEGHAAQKDKQTKADVVAQSKLYKHFQAFQPGELDLTGFEAAHRETGV